MERLQTLMLMGLLAGGCSSADGGAGAPARPSPVHACVTPRDCRGMLPRLCRTCASGETVCAHWTCEAGVCGVATCPVTAAPAK